MEKGAKRIKTKQETFFKKKWLLFTNNLDSSFLAIANMLRNKKKFTKEHHFGLIDMCTLMSIDVSCAIEMHQWLKVMKNSITQGM